MEKQSQILTSSEQFQEILESLGYKLIDCGDHWRTQALYRDGDNKTALKIYKNTGVWMDFVENKGSKPFEALLKATLKDNSTDLKSVLSKVNLSDVKTYKKKATLEMEKIYPEDCLENLFPNYKFYKDRKSVV